VSEVRSSEQGSASAPEEAARRATPAAAAPVSEPAAMPERVVEMAGMLDEIEDLADLPVADHVARYEALHARLQDSLASIDEA
jgi:hypothetical protein